MPIATTSGDEHNFTQILLVFFFYYHSTNVSVSLNKKKKFFLILLICNEQLAIYGQPFLHLYFETKIDRGKKRRRKKSGEIFSI